MPRRTGRGADYEWEAVCLQSSSVDLAVNTAFSLLLFTAQTTLTVMRTRGLIGAQLNLQAADNRVLVGLGIIVASSDAAGQGSPALPKPVSDGGAPWLWHGYLWLAGQGTSDAGEWGQQQRLVIDSKAMRKMKKTEVLVLVGEVCASVDATATFDVDVGARVLVGT